MCYEGIKHIQRGETKITKNEKYQKKRLADQHEDISYISRTNGTGKSRKRRRSRIDIFAMGELQDAIGKARYMKAAGPYGVNAK
jgi:hypothetical protein